MMVILVIVEIVVTVVKKEFDDMEIVADDDGIDKGIEPGGDFDDGVGFDDEYTDNQNYHKVYDHCHCTGKYKDLCIVSVI